jgi:hypothetical protein
MNFYKFLSTFVVIFALLDPDPDPDSESGSTDPIEYGSNPDPDPQTWFQIHDILEWIRISGSMPLTFSSLTFKMPTKKQF